MKKNRGMSLIELVVVIALVGILLGLVIPSVSALFGYEAQKATEKMYSSLESVRTEAMSRLVGGIRIFKEGDSYYTQVNYSGGKSESFAMRLQEKEQIANHRVSISYEVKGYPDMWESIDTTGIILLYDRTTGGFRPIQTSWPSVDSTTLKVSFTETGDYCTRIKITGGMRTRIITLNIETGTFQIKGV